MDDVAIRLKCLEIANGEHPGTRLMRAEELYQWVKSAPPVQGSESLDGRSPTSGAENAAGSVGFKMTEEHYARLGVDPDELKRMSES